MTIDLARAKAHIARTMANAVLDRAGSVSACAGRVLRTARGVPGERTGPVLPSGDTPPRRPDGERSECLAVREGPQLAAHVRVLLCTVMPPEIHGHGLCAFSDPLCPFP